MQDRFKNSLSVLRIRLGRMPTTHPALWRGCQIIKRGYEAVPALTKLIFELGKGDLDTLKQASMDLPLSWA